MQNNSLQFMAKTSEGVLQNTVDVLDVPQRAVFLNNQYDYLETSS